MADRYLEIFHISAEKIKEWQGSRSVFGDYAARFQAEVAALGLEPHHEMSIDCPGPLPNLPRDAVIVLGGAVGEWCVASRKAELEEAGYQVMINYVLTLYLGELERKIPILNQ